MSVLKCINAFTQTISPTTLFLAAKVEEQPRKLEHVIKVAHACLNPQESPLDTKSNVSSGDCTHCMVVSFFFPLSTSVFPVRSLVMVSLCINWLCHALYNGLIFPALACCWCVTQTYTYQHFFDINREMSLSVLEFWPF